MSFNSIEFLIFLPIVFLLYYTSNKRSWQNLLIVIASYIFYGWWDTRFLLLIAFSTLCSYASGIAMLRTQQHRKAICIANVVLNLCILGVFKYFNFFAESAADILQLLGLHASWTTLNIILPVGISFYTFQALSYTIDIYRGDIRAEHDAMAFFAYICFFPQLVAGPIERATNLLPQFNVARSCNHAHAIDGLRQALWGFFKKIVIADNCAHSADMIFNNYTQHNSATLIYGALLFSIQIYADFSGYSDIAIGVAKLFGIRLIRNFNNPYFSLSLSDFWRRWHISLMSWLRDYVYIPLGGNRHGNAITARNVSAVFLLSGLWHGANWTFVAWGAYHALLRLPRTLLGTKEKSPDSMSLIERIMRGCIVFSLVVIGWIIFRAPTIADAWHYISLMITNGGFSIFGIKRLLCLNIIIMLATEYAMRHHEHGLQIGNGVIRSTTLRWSIYYAIAWTILWQTSSSTQFIYFQF